MDRDLFLAILAMDAYNRGYGAGITGLPNGGAIGGATIKDVVLPAGSVAAGFYAIAYNWGGETVISYRGTDANFNPGDPDGSDLVNGYGGALAFAFSNQSALALDFAASVAARMNPDNGSEYPTPAALAPLTANITYTGHSLGGGLAGYLESAVKVC